MYIVTGAAGLIGSAVVWELNRRGIDSILLVDNLGTSDKWKNLRALKYTDYVEKDNFLKLIQAEEEFDGNVEALIHMGACSTTYENNASYLVDNNYNYTVELAEYCVARKIKFLYASSSATYGDGSLGFSDELDNIEQLRPMNMYGYSKQMFDLWAKHNNLFDRITGLKFTNVFGPNELHKGEMRSVVCRAFEQIQESGKIKLFKSYKQEYANGEQKRDFLYVKDAVKIILFLMENSIHGLYNIGSGRAETWNSLAEACFEAMDIEKKIEYIEMPEHLKERYQYYTKAAIGKLNSTGWKEDAQPLKDTIADYIKNYLRPAKHLGDE